MYDEDQKAEDRPKPQSRIAREMPTQRDASPPRPEILIAGENPAMCDALARHLAQTQDSPCEFAGLSDQRIVEIAGEARPKILVLDPVELELNETNDLCDEAARIRRVSPSTRILAYTKRLDENMLSAVLRARLAGCVGKCSELDQLEMAVMVARCGGTFFDRAFAHLLHDLLKSDQAEQSLLSKREYDVIVKTARGQPAKQIAAQLNISAKTVDTYRARALNKLGLQSRAELVNHAVAQGWLS